MQIFPAIDIIDKKVVRLKKGDYGEKTVYSDNPVKIAQSFMNAGAKNLHTVDLDAAKSGSSDNVGVIKSLCEINGLFVEVGGGIRSMDTIERYLSLGAGRVILGTAAVRNYSLVVEAVQNFGDKIAVGVDAKDGKVAVSGWLENTDTPSVDFCKKLRDTGVKTVIYTDISKDGMLSGTNLEVYKELSKIDGLDIVASGGISFESEITALNDMGVYGAILGKALYCDKLDLRRVIALCKE